ncbi:putative ribonuclease H-like domain-containing protein [Rosa chinensis]|uniref:Putative ribonuclease H-like domain-containing protein n=2 Tax=Rosa chinensis TaxID=74649 RepID=A0A2P6QBT9_ROSCH|nr:putative ribonuclease H-like domain-containing protein [Rosa chinensis]
MSDSTKVVTEIVCEHGAVHLCLYLITQKIRDEKDNMVVGFDRECSLVDTEDGRVEPRVVLIKLFSCVGCVLTRLNHKSGHVCPSLLNFFMMKDIVFVGVHVNEDVRMLKENYGVVVRNVVELSELAAYGLQKPRLFAYGARDLARDVLKLGLEQRPQKVAWMSWTEEFLTAEQIECVTIEAYVAYKTGKKLLSS